MRAASRLEKRNVAILVASQTLYMVATITVMTLSGVVGHRLTPAAGLATLPVAMLMIGTLLATLPASLYMKRVGRRRGFMVGAALGGALGGLVAFAAIALEHFWLFCLGNLLLGGYQGFAMYYRFAAVDVTRPAFRSRAISLVLAGGVVAAFLGPWNASLTNDWIATVPDGGPYLMIAGLALAAMLILGGLRVPASGEPAPGEFARPMAEIGAQARFWVALVAAATGYAIMGLVMTATPLSMRALGFEMGQVAIVMQWHVLGMFAPSFVTGDLIARFGVIRILLVGTAILAVSSLLAASGTGLVHFWAALLMLGVGWNFLFIGGSTLLASTHSEAERGKVQGVNDLVIFSLVAAGSLLSGNLLRQLGWTGLNLAMLGPIVLVAVLIAWFKLNEARDRPAQLSGERR
ncbi:MFS transporter [Halomonas saccharevitans]|uniref:MFS transporter n=1 Tax=Halomonas saccharevitans TaxID=416872 RepID=A0ABU3NBN1_9GAMM|nr:MFS transporter [Halomonas saccharevitans]MDT8878598.1 MFS transporter [Halomonas saccharevitans]